MLQRFDFIREIEKTAKRTSVEAGGCDRKNLPGHWYVVLVFNSDCMFSGSAF